jgi:eukaryotic-like serine/threonine-protein kinase
VLVNQGEDPATTPEAAPPATSAASARTTSESPATTSAAPTTTSAAPTTTTEPTTTAAEAPTTDPVAFVQSYYALLPEDTDAAFAMLGPQAQSQSNGRSGFAGFYGRMRAVDIEGARATGDNTVVGTVVFTQRDGSVSREPYRFVVGTRDGQPVIESFSQG